MEVSPLIEFNWTLLMQGVTVVVLFLILKKRFFEKVHTFIKKREESVADAISSAEAVNRKADEKMDDYMRKIAKYKSEGREIIRKARSRAEDKSKEIIEEANIRANEMILAADREIEREKEKALIDMREEVGAIAILAAEKILEQKIEDENIQSQIVDKIIKEAGASKWQS